MDNSLKSTSNKNIRKIRRGDFGVYNDTILSFPDKGTFNILEELQKKASETCYCGGNKQIDNKNDEEYIESFPKDKRCLEYIKLLSNDILKQQINIDKRRIKGPKPGEEPSIEYKNLNRLEQAKYHLNKARQLYNAGRGFILKGLRDNIQFLINKGNGMIYNVDKNNPQLPKKGKKSALYELHNAYIKIRDYEMNPLPPLLEDGTINKERIKEDSIYNFIMGSTRLNPNRLSLDHSTRMIWYSNGYIDSNNYITFKDTKIYENVYDDDAAFIISFKRYLKDENLKTNDINFNFPSIEELENKGYFLQYEITDMAKALLDVHNNFIDPLPVLIDEEEEIKRKETMIEIKLNELDLEDTIIVPLGSIIGPSEFLFPIILELGEPYLNEITWPFFDIPFDPNYIPIFFPTGESFYEFAKPPYKQIKTNPTYGEPDPIYTNKWDARYSTNLLVSYNTRLEQQALENTKIKRILTSKIKRLPPDIKPYTYWENGKTITLQNSILPPNTFDNNKLNINTFGTNTNLYYEKGYSIIPNYEIDTFYPYGIKEQNILRKTNLSNYTKQEQINLLQHALFLLNAPLNQWQKQYLPEMFWLHEPEYISTIPGSYTFGDSFPGEGYDRRDNHGFIDVNGMGWRGYENAMLNPISGRINNKIPNNIETNNHPIGPLYLDKKFCENRYHIPGEYYNSENKIPFWVIKTNQLKVLNENTWGLDFYI